jgi:hypothetical protein
MWNPLKRLDQFGGVKADGLGKLQELDDIDAPAAALNAGDKGL